MSLSAPSWGVTVSRGARGENSPVAFLLSRPLQPVEDVLAQGTVIGNSLFMNVIK